MRYTVHYEEIFLVILALGVLTITALFIRGEEDTWICDKEKGEWVKRGVPSAPMPIDPCGEP